MAKCAICKSEVKELILGKIKGTYLKGKGKVYVVCNECQRAHSIDEIKKILKVD